MIVSAALDNPDKLDDAAIDFLVRHLDLAELTTVTKSSKGLGARIWKQDPARFDGLLEGGERGRKVAESTLADLDLSDLIDGLGKAPQLAPRTLSLRPDLVTSEDFWRRDFVPVDLAFSVLADSPELRDSAVDAMILAGRDDLGPRALRAVGALTLLRRVARHQQAFSGDHLHMNWLRAASSEPDVVAEFLSKEPAPLWSFLASIAAFLTPDAVPNVYGADPWLLAAKAAAQSERTSPPIYLSAFLLNRALGSRSRNPGELAQLGFEQIHRAASVNQIPEEAWSVLQPRLPWSFSWFSWDRCPRIRAAVADLFVDRELSPELFARITNDDQLFEMMADMVARSGRGRRFLKRVQRWMSEAEPMRHGKRIDTIKALLA